MAKNWEFNHKIVIIVEGVNDKLFLDGFLKHLKADTDQVIVEPAGGVDQILNPLDTYLKKISTNGREPLTTLIIIVDRDSHVEQRDKRFKDIEKCLKNNNFPAPTSENTLSEVLNGFKTGIYVMPGSGEGHMIEDLLFQSIETDQQTLINNFYDGFDALPADKKHKHQYDKKPKYISSKVKLKVYRATLSERISHECVMKSHWDFNHDAFKELEGFLRGILHDIESN